METMTVRQSWSDDRIDSLDRKVDEGFRHVDERFEQVDRQFDQVDKRFDQIDQRFDRIEQEMSTRFNAFELRLGSLEEGLRGFHRTLVTLCIGLFAAFATLFGALFAVVVTQV
jgi:tetrahydromethanopterin S-methyltransferase subunit G